MAETGEFPPGVTTFRGVETRGDMSVILALRHEPARLAKYLLKTDHGDEGGDEVPREEPKREEVAEPEAPVREEKPKERTPKPRYAPAIPLEMRERRLAIEEAKAEAAHAKAVTVKKGFENVIKLLEAIDRKLNETLRILDEATKVLEGRHGREGR